MFGKLNLLLNYIQIEILNSVIFLNRHISIAENWQLIFRLGIKISTAVRKSWPYEKNFVFSFHFVFFSFTMVVSGKSLVLTKILFLRLVSICFTVAFVSLYLQIPGLFGPDGVLPVYMILSKLDKATTLFQLANQMADKPTLILSASYLKIAPGRSWY